jgi:hypothetical protein
MEGFVEERIGAARVEDLAALKIARTLVLK